MDREIDVSVVNGIVRAVIKGEMEPTRGTRAIALAAGVAADAKSNLLLLDITGAEYRDFHAKAMEHAQNASATGVMKFCIAILGKDGDPKLAYLENVAINRGIRARAFTRESDAIAWLHSRSGR
jgi:hypothetical protein